ncbi:MAG TPA: STAS domain-containing protein [Thermoanaerobaculia bacterium]
MFVEDEESGSTTVLRLGGMVKVGETVRELESRLVEIAAEQTGSVILDLTDLEYMDSTTLGVLVGALHRFKSQNRELALVHPRERIAALLRVANLDSLFHIYPTVTEALASLRRAEEDTGVD